MFTTMKLLLQFINNFVNNYIEVYYDAQDLVSRYVKAEFFRKLHKAVLSWVTLLRTLSSTKEAFQISQFQADLEHQ